MSLRSLGGIRYPLGTDVIMAKFQILSKILELQLGSHASERLTHSLDDFMASIAGDKIGISKAVDDEVNVSLKLVIRR